MKAYLEQFEAEMSELGSCCNCGRADGVTNIVMLNRRAPTPGKGWGCVVCNLPSDGAVAVLCDVCFTIGEYPKTVCTGYATEPGRTPYDDLDPIVFDHDPKVDHE